MRVNESDTTNRWKIALLNGLNMTNLGQRDKHVYGTIGSLQELEDLVASVATKLGAGTPTPIAPPMAPKPTIRAPAINLSSSIFSPY